MAVMASPREELHGLIREGLGGWVDSVQKTTPQGGTASSQPTTGLPSSGPAVETSTSLSNSVGTAPRLSFTAWVVQKGRALARKPWWLVFALLLMMAIIGFGVWGVIAAAHSESATRWTMAETAAREKALNVKTVIDGAFNPCVTMAMLIRQQPSNWTALNNTFYQVALEILKLTQSNSIFNIQLAPNSIIQSIIPITGFAKAIGLDLLTSADRRPDSLKAIATDSITVAGPNMLVVGIMGLVGRYPVFVPDMAVDETFGFGPLGDYPETAPPCCTTPCSTLPPDSLGSTPCCNSSSCYECGSSWSTSTARWDACRPDDPAPGMGIYHPRYGNCSFSTCYHNATRAKFWGFTQVVVTWEKAKQAAQLYELCAQFDFIMTYTDVFGNPNTPIAMCADTVLVPTQYPGIYNGTLGPYKLSDYLPRNPVSVTFAALNNEWTLWVVDKRGWTPDWQAPLIASVVVIALLVTALIVLLIASHLQQQQLLEEQRASNKKLAQTKAVLEAEKATTDALIVRQLNLISCFAAADEAAGGRAARTSMEQQTLSRIEAVRRQVNSGQREADQVQVLDMLGEGSFGKVYKGLWRGTEVAIKTIVLPANMSGAAKREKMAIMEAAISSSLMHPNVVQTYTYSIRPLRDSIAATEPDTSDGNPPLMKIDTYNSSWQKLQSVHEVAAEADTQTTSGQIISYEVRLVLEYCDRGCLRDALDGGVFFTSTGLNYRAILDTASDVAKAMVHLHLANVLHSDLKARNIMLKSSGSDGRGSVAKVADFGLSISLDSTQTHASSLFQGTLTHMAPEVIMKGHVSKAADVYAFGIMLWEIMTGSTPFRDVPGPHIGHAITALKKRPEFSVAVPRAYKDLAEACWADVPDARPTFDEVLARLQAMRAELPGSTEAMPIVEAPQRPNHSRDRQSPGMVVPRHVYVLGPEVDSINSAVVVGVDGDSSYRENRVGGVGGPGGVGAGDVGGGAPGGAGTIVIGVGAQASLHSCVPRSRLAGVPEGNESSETTTSESNVM